MPSEFDLIRRYFTHPARNAVLGVGDDAAIVGVRRGCEIVISADMLVAGRHFFNNTAPRLLGHKALAVNLSDMAAMGATPRWATLALALPRADAHWLAEFSRGFMALARRFKVDLIGGDTTRGPLNICVQIMGEVPRGTALRRDGARSGDDIWISGTLGDAALALVALKGRIRLRRAEFERCALRLHRPQPRVALGLGLRGVAHSAIDISDGLFSDLGHILERSGVAAEVELAALPLSRDVRRYLDHAAGWRALLAGGDDYELCFTASPRVRERIVRIGRRGGISLTRIGRIQARSRASPRLVVRTADGKALRTMPGATIISAETRVRPDLGFVWRHPAHVIAFGGGAGLVPRAPGTAGTLLAFPIYWGLALFCPVPVLLVVIALGFAAGIWACGRTGRALGVPDHGGMVWDEIIAFLLVLVFTPAGALWQAFAFLLFRLFDILKPPPIRYFDRKWKSGFGVMFDDLLAAAYTLLLLVVFQLIIPAY